MEGWDGCRGCSASVGHTLFPAKASWELRSLSGAMKHLLAWHVGQLISMQLLCLASKTPSSLGCSLSSWLWQCHSSVDAFL